MDGGRDDGELPRNRLTEREIERLRTVLRLLPKLEHVIEEDEFAGRFWATVRKGAYWIVGLVTGVVMLRENLKALWLWLIK